MFDYSTEYEKSIRLVDPEGYAITEREVFNRKEAKDTANYLMSKAYAEVCETGNLNFSHCELWVKGEHIQDYYEKK